MKRAMPVLVVVLLIPYLAAATFAVDVFLSLPGAISQRIVRVDLIDDDGVGDIVVDVHYDLSTNNAEAIALGAHKRSYVVKMEGTRATIVAAAASIIGASLVVNDGGWPEGAVPLPRPRKP
jgi:hypothetical protein